MANQAIALQARAPQSDFMGTAIRNNAALINQMAQQRAAQRQTAVAEQQMAINAAQEQREVTRAQVELAKNVAANFRDELNMLPPNDLAGAQALRQRVVETIPGWDKILPSAEQIASDPQTRQRLLMKADEIVKYSYATPVASVTMDPEGRAFNTVAGGLPGVSGAFPMQQYEMDNPPAAGAAPQAGAAPTPPKLRQPTPVSPEVLDAAAAAIAEGKDLSDPRLKALPPDAFDKAQSRAMRLRLDTMPPVEGAVQPMAMQQGQADLPRIVQTMMQTGFVPQSDFEAMRQAAGPEKATQLAQIMRDNGIQIVPDAAPQGGMRDGAYRPEEGLAVLQRGAPDATLEEAQYRPTGKQFVGRPMIPPSANVPAPVLKGQKAAETAGSEGVKISTQPQIVAGEERSKRLEKLRGELPVAKSQTDALVENLSQRIRAIDEFLANKYRGSIIGSIEGRIPKIFQDEERADAQAQWDFITNNAVLEKLIEDRRSTETGASPQGLVSDRDLGVAATAASKLTQTGSQKAQEQELLRIRNVWYNTIKRAQQTYDNTYREVTNNDPRFRLRLPPVSSRYSPKNVGVTPNTQRTKGGAIVTDW